MAKLAYVAIGVIWGTAGIWMLVFPSIWRSALTSKLQNPGFRFLILQGMVLAGLVLVIGTTGFQGIGGWVFMGCLGIALAAFLLGCSSPMRNHVLRSSAQWPLWWYRLGGVVMIMLSLLFGADVILYGS